MHNCTRSLCTSISGVLVARLIAFGTMVVIPMLAPVNEAAGLAIPLASAKVVHKVFVPKRLLHHGNELLIGAGKIVFRDAIPLSILFPNAQHFFGYLLLTSIQALVMFRMVR
jgi:hypothetical protein